MKGLWQRIKNQTLVIILEDCRKIQRDRNFQVISPEEFWL